MGWGIVKMRVIGSENSWHKDDGGLQLFNPVLVRQVQGTLPK